MQRIVQKGVYVVVLLVFCGGYAAAEDAVVCKGLAEAACRAEKSCSWVKPGKTVTGKQRAAYCRKKPAKRKSTPAAGGSTDDAADKK